MRRLLLVGLLSGATGSAALASPYGQYPAPVDYPLQRSMLTPRRVVIMPYVEPFRVRVYTTPPTPPYYDVPPYAVAAPY